MPYIPMITFPSIFAVSNRTYSFLRQKASPNFFPFFISMPQNHVHSSSHYHPLLSLYSQLLENHLMRPLVAPEAEARTQVSFQIRCLLDAGHNTLIHCLLILNSLGINFLLGRRLTALFEEIVLFFLLTRPVLILGYARNDVGVYSGDVDDGRGGNDVAVVYAAQRDAVGFERAGDEEDALLELAQEHDALTAEAAREEDQDGSGGERVAVFGRVCGFARL